MSDGATPLWMAAQEGHDTIVRRAGLPGCHAAIPVCISALHPARFTAMWMHREVHDTHTRPHPHPFPSCGRVSCQLLFAVCLVCVPHAANSFWWVVLDVTGRPLN